MLLAIGYFLCFQMLGIISIRLIFPRRKPLDRLWLGMSLGLLEEIWIPALFAFVFSFQIQAHLMALATGGVITAFCWWGRDRRPVRKWNDEERRYALQIAGIVIPLTVLGGYLQYTHVMRIDENGNWNVGQSTYGDLPMHLSFITGLVGKKFPADYPFYPGNRLNYPFLTDSLSSTFYLMGCSLQAATILPGTYMMAICYMGVLILAREMTTGRKAMILASLLFFLNGGLGFFYDFDQAAGFNPSGGLTVLDRLRHILEGYYKTPTNQPEPNNLRWSNVICDLMIPQRTLLGGWAMGIPCFYLMETLFRPNGRDPAEHPRGPVLLGFWAGALPMIHTHTFVALALSSAGVLGYDLIHGDQTHNRSRKQILWPYLQYGCIAAAIALPQLAGFTFSQAFQHGEGHHSFMVFQFNWVNNPSGKGMRDFYLWFYIKNIGIPFIILLLAVFEKDSRQRRLFSEMVLIVVAAETIRFQPNEYDNNKLFYLAWMIGCMIVSNWIAHVWHLLKNLRGRTLMAAGTAVVFFLSPVLTILRECVSSYQAFSAAAVESGEYARNHTEENAVFLTGTQHLNPISAIAGRTIVCGPDLWLYWHGFDTTERKIDIQNFFENPEGFSWVLEKYDAKYIYVSSYERNSYEINETALERMFEVQFRNNEAIIYRVTEPETD